MTTPLIDQLITNPPSPFSAQIKNWANSLCVELEQYLLDPTIQRTNYYVHSTGSISGLGTQANPISISGIPSRLGNNRKFLFAAGDEIIAHSGLDLTVGSYSNMAFEAYGDIAALGKPRIHNFQKFPQSNLWINQPLAGPNVYAMTGIFPTHIGMIREYGNFTKRYTPPRYMPNLVSLSGTVRSWHWSAASGGAVFVNFGDVHPNTLDLEICPQTQQDGMKLGGDRTFVRNLIIEGIGCLSTAGGDSYGVRLTAKGEEIQGLFGVEAYYNGRHNFGQTNSTASGIIFLQDCNAGYCNNIALAGANEYVAYSNNGGHVAIHNRCNSQFGDVPTATVLPNSGSSGSATSYYAHTAGGATQKAKLLLWNECGGIDSNIPGAVPPNGWVTSADTPGVTGVFSTARTFVIDHTVNTRGESVFGLPNNVIYINPYVRFFARGNTTTTISPFGQLAGAMINPIIDLNNILYSSHVRAIFAYSVAKTDALILNGHIRVTGSGAGQMVLSYSQVADAGSGLKIANTIVSAGGPKALWVGTVNNSSNLLNNAFYNVPSGNNLDGSLVEPGWGDPSTLSVGLTSLPEFISIPGTGSPLYASGAVTPYGYNLEYDFNWRKRSPVLRSIGPFQAAYLITSNTSDVAQTAKPGSLARNGGSIVAGGGIQRFTKQVGDTNTFTGLEQRLQNRFDDYSYYE